MAEAQAFVLSCAQLQYAKLTHSKNTLTPSLSARLSFTSQDNA